jgi:hypothetical protein
MSARSAVRRAPGVRIHDHDDVVVALLRQQAPEHLVERAGLLAGVGDRLDHLDACSLGDRDGGVGAVVRDDDDPLRAVRLADEGRDRRQEGRLFVVRRDQDGDGDRAVEDVLGPRHDDLGGQRVGPDIHGAARLVGDPPFEQRHTGGEQDGHSDGCHCHSWRRGFGRVQDGPDTEEEPPGRCDPGRRPGRQRGEQHQPGPAAGQAEDQEADQPGEPPLVAAAPGRRGGIGADVGHHGRCRPLSGTAQSVGLVEEARCSLRHVPPVPSVLRTGACRQQVHRQPLRHW